MLRVRRGARGSFQRGYVLNWWDGGGGRRVVGGAALKRDTVLKDRNGEGADQDGIVSQEYAEWPRVIGRHARWSRLRHMPYMVWPDGSVEDILPIWMRDVVGAPSCCLRQVYTYR